ncbi:MAG: hypothetical protein K2J10_07460, partial [Muribaculaceae bacterium]|nr:hypothetical protein [Muribaculaceae bacterium]
CDLLKSNAIKKGDNRQGGSLAFKVYDPTINREIMMTSSLKVPVERAFIEELRRIDNLEFTVEHV